MTVLEVLVSFGLIAVAALGIIATMTRLVFAQSSSSHQTVATIIAESKLEEAVLACNSDGLMSATVSKNSVRAAVGQQEVPTEFFYAVTVTKILKGTSWASGRNMGDLYEFKITVTWNGDEDGPRGAVERGAQTVVETRVVYLER